MFKKNVILVNGEKTFYWEKNNGQENTLIVLHGFPGNHKIVIDMAKKLGNYRIIIPDLPACGLSDSLGKEHFSANFAEWLYGFLVNIGIDKTIIVGYSFGSRIAAIFSSIYPEKVEKLVLITPVVKFDSLIARLASFEYEIAERLPLYMQKTWLSNKIYHDAKNVIIFKSAGKKRRQHLIYNDSEEIKHLNPRANLEIFNDFFTSKSISDGSKINIKTLIIAADKDEIATVSSVKELCARFTNFELEIVKNSGHIVVAERPQKIAGIINNWLA